MTEQRERRLIVDYVRTKYPNNTAYFNLRIGGVPDKFNMDPDDEANQSLARPWNRYVDALVVTNTELILIEAKLPAKLEAVAQLMLYQELIPKTPMLKQYAHLPIRLLLVTALPDPELVQFAQKYGIDVDIYQPAYAMQYLELLLKGKVVPYNAV
jgi:hypothetical protein